MTKVLVLQDASNVSQQPKKQWIKKWKLNQKCEIYSKERKGWSKCEIIDIFTGEEGEWVKVKYDRNTKEMSPNDPNLRSLAPEENKLNWRNVVEAVKHELYPVMATSLGQSVDGLVHSDTVSPEDLSDEATDKVITELKAKKLLYNNEIEYIQELVKRARTYRWKESESMFLYHL